MTEPVTRLCPKSLCADTGPREVEAGDVAGTASPDAEDESFPERMKSMASDLGIVSLHLVLPDDLREHLPSVSEQLGNFGAKEKKAAPAALPEPPGPAAGQRVGPAPAAPRHRTRAHRADPRGQEGRAVAARLPALHRRRSSPTRAPASRRSTSCTSCSLTTRGTTCPRGAPTASREPQIPGLRDNVWNGDGEAVDQGWQRHLLQVGYVDRELGVLMTKLRATGLWDRALIVLAADHGVAFAPNSPRRKITKQDVGGIAPVPFFMKLPRESRGRVLDKHVQTIDILPSIADALDFELPEKSDGQSALSDDFRPSPKVPRLVHDLDHGVQAPRDPLPALPGAPRARWSTSRRRCSGPAARVPACCGRSGRTASWSGARWPPLRSPVRCPPACATTTPRSSSAWTPAATWAPSHVSGKIDGLPAGRNLALAVNGRIRAVARTYDFLGKTRFSFMAPEAAFRPGANDVRVLAVTGSGRGLRLAALGA